MGERVLVTGSAGIVGSHVMRSLARTENVEALVGLDPVSGHPYAPELDGTIPVYPVDVRDQAAMLRILTQYEITAVLHLVAVQGGWYDTNPEISFAVNLGASTSVFQACEMAQVRRVVFASSRAVYFALPDSALTEERTYPKTPYGLSKLAAECVGRHRALQGGPEFVGVRFADFVCTERLRRRPVRSVGRGEVVNNLILAGIYQTPVRLQLPSDSLVDTLYAGDLGELVGDLLIKDGILSHQTYNIGVGVPGITFAGLVEACAHVFGTGLYELHDTGKEEHRGVLDTSRLAAEVGRSARGVSEFLSSMRDDVNTGREHGVLPAHGGEWLEKPGLIELI